jgi:hypothetical protein
MAFKEIFKAYRYNKGYDKAIGGMAFIESGVGKPSFIW